MNFIKNNLPVLFLIIVCAVGIFVYQSYFASAPSDVLQSGAASTTPPGANLFASITELKSVSLDPSVFSDPVFASLVDFGVSIPPEPVGRPNPFAPLSGISLSAQGGSAPASAVSTGSGPTGSSFPTPVPPTSTKGKRAH